MSSGVEGLVVSLPHTPQERVRSLYVHAPFCARRCSYCDFAVEVRSRPDVDAWIAALAGELEALRAEGRFELARPLRTLYVGGGTPSLLGPAAMHRLNAALGHGLVSEESEWTAEANPESFTEDVAIRWRDAGVNRLSLGAQSFDPAALRWMGRLHGPEGIADAVSRARRAGFENVSLDLMFALPGRLARQWRMDLECALALEPTHVSLYGLTIEPGTLLGAAVSAGRETPADEERYRDEFLQAVERLTAEGYVHYEVSSFALPGYRSGHNQSYWSGEPFIGLGNGAHSYLHPMRRWNLRSWGEYEGVARRGRLPVAGHENLDWERARLERVWLGLRSDRGLSTRDLSQGALQMIECWERRGLAYVEPEVVRLTASGWLVIDQLAVELDGALAGTSGEASSVGWASEARNPASSVGT